MSRWLLLALLVSTACVTVAQGCSSAAPRDDDSESTAAGGHDGAISLGLGGQGGEYGGGEPGGSSGSGGGSGASGQSGGGGVGGIGGEGGAASAGGAGASGTCPPENLTPMPSCSAPDKPACASCVCMDPTCAEIWASCLANDGCSRAVDCIGKGCSSATCAQVVGDGQVTLLALLECFSSTCGAICSGNAGSGGESGAGGEAGSAGDGGSGGDGSAGEAGAGGESDAGAGGEATAGAAGEDAGGEAGAAGEGGAAGESDAGAGGEAGEAGSGAEDLYACKVPLASPSAGECIGLQQGTCNPITNAPCQVQSGEVCEASLDESGQVAFLCQQHKLSVDVCQPCDELEKRCAAGLTCTITGVCAKVCCVDADCGSNNRCEPQAHGELAVGVCIRGEQEAPAAQP